MAAAVWNLSWAQSGLESLAVAWRDAEDRPRIAPDLQEHWDDLIRWWVEKSELPLPLRSTLGTRGSVQEIHGRSWVFVDNSPPQWVFARALEGWAPSRDQLVSAVLTEMPVAQVLPVAHRPAATLTRLLSQGPSTSKLGLKLHHIDAVSKGGPIAKRTLEQMEAATLRLLSPSNMFVLPLAVSGLGEIELFIDVMRRSLDRGVPGADDGQAS